MSKGDLLVERGANGLEQLSRKAAAKGGFVATLADELAEDAAFLRKLKPSLIKARAKGTAPTASVPDWEPQAPTAPQASKPRPSRGRSGSEKARTRRDQARSWSWAPPSQQASSSPR